MSEPLVRGLGLVASACAAAALAWMAASQPRTVAEITGGLAATIGAYRIDEVAFADGRRHFHADRFVEARAAFARADPAARDAVTQFYVAYTYYRQGWGRLGHDDTLYAAGLAAVDRAIAVADGGRIVVDDERLGLRTADELRTELEAGLTREWSDFNPLRVLEPRK